MPFVAEHDGSEVIPEEVGEDTYVSCFECGEDMTVIRSHRRDGTFVARHFRHKSNVGGDNGGGGGCGYESDAHRRMKSIALSKLKDTFPVESWGSEVPIGDRRADVLVQFEHDIPRFGRGAIAEVQYRNEQKDTTAVTEEYTRAGYTVYWLDELDFEGKDVSLEDPEMVWPNAVPEHEYREYDQSDDFQEIDGPWGVDVGFSLDWFEAELREAWSIGTTLFEIEEGEKLERPHTYSRFKDPDTDQECERCRDNHAQFHVYGSGYLCQFCMHEVYAI